MNSPAMCIAIAILILSMFYSSIPKQAESTSDYNHDEELAKAQADAHISHKEFTLVAEDAHLNMAGEAPGQNVSVWTYNGTVPGPTIRVTENDSVTIHFVNNGTFPHTIHFHGDHAEVNDGVTPEISPGETYHYNFTAEPSGLLMYHCHMTPTSTHIRMGMYGAIIVDPKHTQLQPAREFLLVMSEHDPTDTPTNRNPTYDPQYYLINGYSNVYHDHPLRANYTDLVRFYVINIGVTIPYSFHLHSTTFKAYPSGLISNTPINAQSFSVGPGDAAIIDAKWKYPGTYLFHSHGRQEERGNMGKINITGSAPPLSKSVSMIDWQYQLQKELQKSRIDTEPTTEHTPGGQNPHTTSPNNTISIPVNASFPNRELYYVPSPSTVPVGTMVNWTNDDPFGSHTVTSSNRTGTSPTSPRIFDSRTVSPVMEFGDKFTFTFNSPGTYSYFCARHPFMTGQVIVK